MRASSGFAIAVAILVSTLVSAAHGATLTLLSDIAEPIGAEPFNEVVVSPDGLHVYAGSDSFGTADPTIAVFSRDLGTGALTFVQLVEGGVGGITDFTGLRQMTFSPDGTTLYVGGGGFSSSGEGFHAFDRDAGTGALTHIQTISTDDTQGIVVSSDGEFVYSDTGLHDVVSWDRDTGTGTPHRSAPRGRQHGGRRRALEHGPQQ